MSEGINILAIEIAIILLPGLVASVICDKLAVHSPKWGGFKYSIYSFLFGILSYALLQLVEYVYQLIVSFACDVEILQSYKLGVWKILHDEKAVIPLHEVGWATVLAPIIALLAAFIVNYKLLNKFAQLLKISQKYGDENLFSFFLTLQQVDWVYIRDKDKGLTYFGRVVSYSECDNMQEVVLSDVDVCEYESSDHLYSVSIVYLSRPVGCFVIEVPHPKENDSEQENNQ